jgi:GNAT superfamily N-acetyltransferase
MLVADAEAVTVLSPQLGYSVSSSQTVAHIKQVLSLQDDCILVASDDAKIIGWVHAFKAIRIETPPFIEIAGLVVDEAYRGKGIGKVLIEKIKIWSGEKNIFTIRIRCNTKRLKAHKFYTDLGFQQSKEQKVFELSLQ